MLRKHALAGMSRRVSEPSPVNKGETLADGENWSDWSSWVREKVTCESAPWLFGDRWRECGDRRKSRDQYFCAWSGLVEEPFARSCIIRFFALGSAAIADSDGRRDLGMGLKETDGS